MPYCTRLVSYWAPYHVLGVSEYFTGVLTSRAPGKTSGGYGSAPCSALERLGSWVARGLGTVFGDVLWRENLARARKASVVATLEVMMRLVLRDGGSTSHDRRLRTDIFDKPKVERDSLNPNTNSSKVPDS